MDDAVVTAAATFNDALVMTTAGFAWFDIINDGFNDAIGCFLLDGEMVLRFATYDGLDDGCWLALDVG